MKLSVSHFVFYIAVILMYLKDIISQKKSNPVPYQIRMYQKLYQKSGRIHRLGRQILQPPQELFKLLKFVPVCRGWHPFNEKNEQKKCFEALTVILE